MNMHSLSGMDDEKVDSVKDLKRSILESKKILKSVNKKLNKILKKQKKEQKNV